MVVYLALLAVGFVMLLSGSGFVHALTWAIYLLVVNSIYLILRRTYFKQILSDNRNRRHGGSAPSTEDR